MRRREFISLIGAGGCRRAARRARAAGRSDASACSCLSSRSDPEGQARLAAFVEGLQHLGWTDGRNVKIDVRWPVGDAERSRSAEELIALAPDVILASASASVAALQQDYAQRADRVCGCHRSGGRRVRRQPLAAGRQHHRI